MTTGKGFTIDEGVAKGERRRRISRTVLDDLRSEMGDGVDKVLGNSNEAEFRQRVLNAKLQGAQSGRMLGLEALDMRSTVQEDFPNRLAGGSYRAVDVDVMPTSYTYVLKVDDHYERVIIHMENRVEATGGGVRRPDFLEARYRMSAAEVKKLKRADGTFKPQFRDVRETGLNAINLVIKSIDFNTPLGGKAIAEHVIKHLHTLESAMIQLLNQGLKPVGRVAVSLREQYHENTEVRRAKNGQVSAGVRIRGKPEEQRLNYMWVFDLARDGTPHLLQPEDVARHLGELNPKLLRSTKVSSNFLFMLEGFSGSLEAILNRLGTRAR